MGVSLLVTDLDDTLWNWLEIWHRPFVAMMTEVSALTGLDWATLERSVRPVFQRHGTSEYAFVLDEMKCLREHYGGAVRMDHLRPAVDAYRDARAAVLHPFPGVEETLRELRGRGVRIVAYTESLSCYSRFRLSATRLGGLVDVLYSPPDHALPDGDPRVASDPVDAASVALRHEHTPRGALKPNADILRRILAEMGTPAAEALYVGDSLMKDIRMAQDVGVADAHAVYGCRRDSAAYAQLRRVSHWTDAEVEREKEVLSSGDVVPRYVLQDGFPELLGVISQLEVG